MAQGACYKEEERSLEHVLSFFRPFFFFTLFNWNGFELPRAPSTRLRTVGTQPSRSHRQRVKGENLLLLLRERRGQVKPIYYQATLGRRARRECKLFLLEWSRQRVVI